MSPGVKRFGYPSNVVNRMKPYDKNMSPSKVGHRSQSKAFASLSVDSFSTGTSSSDDSRAPVLKIQDLSLPPFKSPTKSQGCSNVSDTSDQSGFPTLKKWTNIMEDYLAGLHPRKRDKALISQKMHELIYDVLVNPDDTRHGTPQFRFWARKMFSLVEVEGAMAVVHEGRPVAVKEHLYEILCMCHGESGHAGRDKTCKVIRDYYTWVPKELTASFVKHCPTCALRRSGNPVFVQTTYRPIQQVFCEKASDGGFPGYLSGNTLSGSPNDPQYQRPPRRSSSNMRVISNSHMALSDSDVSMASIHNDSYVEGSSHDPSGTRLQPLYTSKVQEPCDGHTLEKDVSLPPLMKWLSDVVGPDSFGPNNTLPAFNSRSSGSSSDSRGSSIPLPPLLDWLYVTQDRDDSDIYTSSGSIINPANVYSNASELVPIDPVLLFEGGKSSQQPVSAMYNAGDLKEEPPACKLTGMLRRTAPTTLQLPGQSALEHLWDQQSSGSTGPTTPSAILSATNTSTSFFPDTNYDLYEEEASDTLSFANNNDLDSYSAYYEDFLT